MEGCEGAGEGFLNTGTERSLNVNILQLHLADVFCPNRETYMVPVSSPAFPQSYNCGPLLNLAASQGGKENSYCSL